MPACMYICMYDCMYLCMCVCVCVCVNVTVHLVVARLLLPGCGLHLSGYLTTRATQ